MACTGTVLVHLHVMPGSRTVDGVATLAVLPAAAAVRRDNKIDFKPETGKPNLCNAVRRSSRVSSCRRGASVGSTGKGEAAAAGTDWRLRMQKVAKSESFVRCSFFSREDKQGKEGN